MSNLSASRLIFFIFAGRPSVFPLVADFAVLDFVFLSSEAFNPGFLAAASNSGEQPLKEQASTSPGEPSIHTAIHATTVAER